MCCICPNIFMCCTTHIQKEKERDIQTVFDQLIRPPDLIGGGLIVLLRFFFYLLLSIWFFVSYLPSSLNSTKTGHNSDDENAATENGGLNIPDHFTARRYANTVLAVIVYLFVCLSVCPSQVGVVQRWLNLGSH